MILEEWTTNVKNLFPLPAEGHPTIHWFSICVGICICVCFCICVCICICVCSFVLVYLCIFELDHDPHLADDHEVVAIEGRPSNHGSQWLSSLAAGERWLTAEDTPDLIFANTFCIQTNILYIQTNVFCIQTNKVCIQTNQFCCRTNEYCNLNKYYLITIMVKNINDFKTNKSFKC